MRSTDTHAILLLMLSCGWYLGLSSEGLGSWLGLIILLISVFYAIYNDSIDAKSETEEKNENRI